MTELELAPSRWAIAAAWFGNICLFLSTAAYLLYRAGVEATTGFASPVDFIIWLAMGCLAFIAFFINARSVLKNQQIRFGSEYVKNKKTCINLKNASFLYKSAEIEISDGKSMISFNSIYFNKVSLMNYLLRVSKIFPAAFKSDP